MKKTGTSNHERYAEQLTNLIEKLDKGVKVKEKVNQPEGFNSPKKVTFISM